MRAGPHGLARELVSALLSHSTDKTPHTDHDLSRQQGLGTLGDREGS
jgi:hypothetical protein